MNKTEYLSALKKALKQIDENVMEEIVLDYEEHFQVGMENGKSEEQICEDLGSIDDLVEEIKEVYNTDNKGNKKEEKKSDEDQTYNKNNKFKDWYSNIHAITIDGEKIGNTINSALDTAGDAISKIDVNEISRSLKSTLDHATSSINNFADSYLKNQGTNPFEFNKKNAEGYTENVSKSYDDSEEAEEVSEDNVSADTESKDETSNNVQADTENKVSEAESSEADSGSNKPDLESSKTESVSNKEESEISEKNSEETASEADEKGNDNSQKANIGLNLVVDGICADIAVQNSTNGKINVSYENNGNERQKQMYEFFSYKEGNTVYAGIRRVGKAVFLFNPTINSIKINIEVPEHMSNINIKTANGNINISNVNSECMLVTSASGDILVDQVHTTDFRIKVSGGDIKLDGVNSNKLNAGTLSGNITANNIEGKFVSLKSTSGDVEVSNIAADVIDSSSLSGNLDVDIMKAGESKIGTTSGDIKIHELTMNNADVSCISGSIKISQVIGDGLRVSSTTGNVKADVNVKRCHASSKSGNVDVKCDGDIVLESSSTSGNVDITLKNYNNGYCIKSRTVSGALYINYDNTRQRNLKAGTYTYGNQGSELILGSVSGDIHLTD